MKPGPKKGAKYKRRKNLTEKRCGVCGKNFYAVLARARYCSARCSDTAAKRRLRGGK